MTEKKTEKCTPYRAPEQLTKKYHSERGLPDPESRPGDLLKFCLQHVYGVRGYQTEISAYLRIVRQTVYQWVKFGIPQERIRSQNDDGEPHFVDFVNDAASAFYLPENVSLEDFERPRDEINRSNEVRRNQILMDFLVDIVAYREEDGMFGVETLDTIAMRMKNVTSPHLFWKWAYTDGGIPVTYIEEWLRYAIELETFRIMPGKYHDPQVFAALVRRRMCVDPDYHLEYYKIDKPAAPLAG